MRNANLLPILLSFAPVLVFAAPASHSPAKSRTPADSAQETAATSAGALSAENSENLAPQDLEGSYRAAIARSETVGMNIELINQAEEKFRQAIAAVLPQVSVVGSYLQQEQPQTASTLYPSSQPLLKLTLTQSIFHGLQQFAGLNYTKKLRQASQQDEEDAKRALFTSVAQNFYLIVSLEKVRADYDSEVASYKKRIQELKQRIKIGRSRRTEVLTVEASLAGLYAQIESVKGQLKVAREMYAFLTGLPAATPILDRQPLIQKLAPVEFYVNGVNQRPDVRANELRLSANQEQLMAAQGARLPSVDFQGNYYLHRFGATQNVSWDVQFLATLPLYTGGTIDSQVRTAASQIRQSQLAVTLARRQAEEQIRAAYRTYVADQAQVAALRKSKSANSLNLEAELHDYRLGLVTNLDVLNALISYQESERALDQMIASAKLDYSLLENVSSMNAWIGAPAEVTTHWSPVSLPVIK